MISSESNKLCYMKDQFECGRKLGVERGFSFLCIYREGIAYVLNTFRWNV